MIEKVQNPRYLVEHGVRLDSLPVGEVVHIMPRGRSRFSYPAVIDSIEPTPQKGNPTVRVLNLWGVNEDDVQNLLEDSRGTGPVNKELVQRLMMLRVFEGDTGDSFYSQEFHVLGGGTTAVLHSWHDWEGEY